ncbi:MAG: FeoB-associated Cys-rich membrane protein [Flavobacteriaceae bacterium]
MGFQEILVCVTLIAALGFLVKKYIWPKTVPGTGKSTRSCGQDDCECH